MASLSEKKPNILGFFLLSLCLLLMQQGIYHTDAMIVGNILGKDRFAAVEATGAMLRLPVNFAVGFSTGITAVLSYRVGAGTNDKGWNTARVCLLTASLIGIAVTFLFFVLAEPFLRWTSVPKNILRDSLLYYRIYILGSVFSFTFNACIGIFRSRGDSLTPLLLMGVALWINVVLDFSLVRPFGLAGAAVATVSTHFFVSALAILLLCRCQLIKLRGALPWREIGSVLRAGIPIGAQSLLFTVTNLFVQSGVNALGSESVAKWGLCNLIDTPIWLVTDALVLTVITFSSHAFAAGNRRALRSCVRITICGGVAVCMLSVALYFFAEPVAALYLHERGIPAAAATLVQWLAPCYVFYYVADVLSAYLRGSGSFALPFWLIALQCAARLTCLFFVSGITESIEGIISAVLLSWGVYILAQAAIGLPKLISKVRSVSGSE